MRTDGRCRRSRMTGRKKRKIGGLAAGCLLAALAGCGQADGAAYLVSPDESYEKEAPDDSAWQVKDQDSLYGKADETEVTVMYLTVGRGNEADGSDHTWSEVNRYPLGYYEENGLSPYLCEAVLQVGDELGPLEGEFGYGQLTPNATVQLKGEKASARQQKSYRINIKEGKGKWKKQKAVVLNKYMQDPLRFCEKLCYSLMQEIPQMMSARTSFVHLYVKDKTEGEDGRFQDYGLYIQTEQINKTYLKNRGLDNDGQLYELKDFDFGRHSDSIRLAADPSYDQNEFEQYLEIKGSGDHTKLIAMLDAVNNPAVPVGSVLDQYFDRENLYCWMAFQILTGDKDSGVNACLYSPQMLDRWYLISRDNDNAFREIYERMKEEADAPSWNQGIFSLTSSVLFARMLQDETCRKELSQTVEWMKEQYLTQEKLQEKAGLYSEIIKPYLYSLPDKMYARVTPEEYDAIAGRLEDEVDRNYRAYQESLLKPWPFRILSPLIRDSRMVVCWEEAYLYGDAQADYLVEVAESPDFRNCILKTTLHADTSLEMDVPAAGQYFIRVRAENQEEQTQDACAYYRTENGTVVYGTQCFYVLEDGSIAVSVYEEGE